MHNRTNIQNVFNQKLVTVGKGTYGPLYVMTFGNSERLCIGNYCSIGPQTAFILNADHYTNTVTTYPFKVRILHSVSYEGVSKGNIIIDDDVWIGYGAIIMSGVHIGQGAVIAAGAVVTRDVPPYAVVGGSPAKILKYRFSKEVIDEIVKLDFSLFDKKFTEKHINDLYTEVRKDNINEILQQLREAVRDVL